MTDITMKIEGMSCQHCVMRVTKALQGLNGIHDLDVQIGTVRLRFDEHSLKKEDIEKAIENAGYRVAR
ncbi:MAG TPA: cation transporter [Thermodesulfovibrionales bacterium]|nr:cation transporter [Thermodesulfovibrionales bacterium]